MEKHALTEEGVETILLVDDDPSILFFMQTILKEERYEIVTATNGVNAQGVLQQRGNGIAAVVLDWSMPKMSGIELLRWMKEQPQIQHIPVIMHTVMDTPEHVREGIDAGAFYYLPKPAQRDVIYSILRAAIFDFNQKRLLFKKLAESENPFSLMTEGIFRFRTIAEGEFLALRIANACPFPERASYLMEMIINAIEHGNLGISYSEKTDFVQDGTWMAEIARRLALPENREKHVHLEIKRHPDKMTVLVRDEGPGFDFHRYLDLDEARVMDNHGRGIAMARAFLGVEYQGNGSTVLVSIPFSE